MDLCIYHGNCNDGYGAALAVWKRFRLNSDYKPYNYGDPPPDVTGKDVVIVDFSFPRPDLLKMKQQANSLLVLDHHKTAEKDLEGLDFCVFDKHKSGAMLAWEYFHPDKPVPMLIKYIQDRDLWEWDFPMSREISAYLGTLRKDPDEVCFNQWNDLLDSNLLWSKVRLGEAILRYQKICVERAVKEVRDNDKLGSLLGYNIPVVNTTHLVSEIVGELAIGYPFAVGYFDKGNKRVFSLRSDENGVDVSEIAKHFGGGGHKHAAGFTGRVEFFSNVDEE